MSQRLGKMAQPHSINDRQSTAAASSGVAAASLLLAMLAGCSGVDAIANHGQLDVHTHMSETIFLDPVGPSLKTIYMGIRNTSDYPTIDVRGPLSQALSARGYTIVDDPALAHYLLQANVLQAGKLNKDQVNGLLSNGFGQPLLAGAVAGGLTGGLTNNAGAGLGVGLGVAAASALLNYAYQDVTYAVTIDIQLSERPLHGEKVYQHTHLHHGHGHASSQTDVTDSTDQSFGVSTSGTDNYAGREQDVDEMADFKKYNIRDVAYADQVNLKMEQAEPLLVQHLASAFANLFE